MLFKDQLTLDAPKRTKDGYLAVRARAARTGVYKYTGQEVDPENKHGLRDKAIVNVLRDADTVFDKSAVQSFIGKPITDDHPSEAVTSENWRDLARGTIMGALRDGEYLSFDLMVTDKAAIDKIDRGKRELSNGYAAELEFGDFKAPDGTVCDARQSKITGGNHIALVDNGRAGDQCRISDGGNGFAACDANPQAIEDLKRIKGMNFIMLDGLKVDLDDGDAVKALVAKLQTQASDAITAKDAAEAQVATLTTEKSTLDAKIVTLEAQVADSAITPAKLRDAAKSYQAVADKANALGVTVADEMDEAAIQKAVVSAKLGDAAKDWSDIQIAASFATLAKDAQPTSQNGTFIPAPIVLGDAATKENQAWQQANDHNSWRTAGSAAN